MIDQATVALGRERAARAKRTRQRHYTEIRKGLMAVHERDGRLTFELRLEVKAVFEPGQPLECLTVDAQRSIALDIQDAARLAEAYELALEDAR